MAKLKFNTYDNVILPESHKYGDMMAMITGYSKGSYRVLVQLPYGDCDTVKLKPIYLKMDPDQSFTEEEKKEHRKEARELGEWCNDQEARGG